MRIRSNLIAVVVSSLVATAAFAAPKVVQGPGPGYFEAKDLVGDAAPAALVYMTKSYIRCLGREGETGVCNLRAVTESMSMVYAGDYAIAYFVLNEDLGANHPGLTRTAMFRKMPDGYALVGIEENGMGLISSLRARKAFVNGMEVAGIVQGPNDAYCCPTKRVSFELRVSEGRIVVSASSGRRRQSASN